MSLQSIADAIRNFPGVTRKNAIHEVGDLLPTKGFPHVAAAEGEDAAALDVGDQYRTGIYTVSYGDLAIARDSLRRLGERLIRPVAVECEPLRCFYTAEEYHQKYLDKNPGGYCHVSWGMIAKAKAWKPGDSTEL